MTFSHHPDSARRRLLLMAGALATSLGAPALAGAQPARPVRIVVPFGPGGVADLTARTVAQQLAAQTGQAFVIDNKPGAGGVVAADMVAKAAPDGHTLLLMSNGTAVSAGLFKSLPFDTVKDFAAISTLGYFDMAVLVPANARWKSLPELLAHARAHPGQVNIATIATGSTQHLAAELFKRSAGIDAQVVPYNGTPAVVTALRGGQVDAAVEMVAPTLAQVTGGALRALAVLGERRVPALADVPTAGESGVARFSVRSWNALAAPARTPPAVVARLQQEVQRALAVPEVQERLRQLGVEARASTPAELAALLTAEIERWSAVIAQAGIAKQ